MTLAKWGDKIFHLITRYQSKLLKLCGYVPDEALISCIYNLLLHMKQFCKRCLQWLLQGFENNSVCVKFQYIKLLIKSISQVGS